MGTLVSLGAGLCRSHGHYTGPVSVIFFGRLPGVAYQMHFFDADYDQFFRVVNFKILGTVTPDQIFSNSPSFQSLGSPCLNYTNMFLKKHTALVEQLISISWVMKPQKMIFSNIFCPSLTTITISYLVVLFEHFYILAQGQGLFLILYFIHLRRVIFGIAESVGLRPTLFLAVGKKPRVNGARLPGTGARGHHEY